MLDAVKRTAFALSMTLLLCALAATVVAQGVAPASAPAADPGLAETLKAVSRFSPRTEGSAMEKELMAWITERLAVMGVASTAFDFEQSDFEHSFSSCLRVDLPGGSRDTVIFAVPLNSPDAAEGDGSVNVALALDLIRQARAAPTPLSVMVLFLGAEYGGTDAYPMGSTLFLHDFQPVYNAAVVYLNLRAVPSRVLVRAGGRGIVSPYWLVNGCVEALRAAGVPYTLRGDEMQVFRLGATDERTLIEPWLRAGYPSVELDGEYGSPEPADDGRRLASISAFLRGFLEADRAGIPEEWDRHYLLLQEGGASLIVDETVYIAILGGTLALLLLYSLVFRAGLKKYLRTLRHNAWAIVPLFVLSFLFLAAGTYALRLILTLRGFEGLWRYAPLEFLGLKIGIALFLYAALYNVFHRLHFPHNGSFYSAAAILFLLIDIFVVAVFNISFTFYFLWALLFVFLSALVRGRWLKILLALPAPYWGIRGILSVFLNPAYPFCHFIMLSPVWGNLLVAGACLPFILVLLRIGLIVPGRGILRRRKRELLMAGLLLGGCAVLFVRLLTFTPFTSGNPQPVTATQVITVDAAGASASTDLVIESPGPVKDLVIEDSTGRRTVSLAATGESLALLAAASPIQVGVTEAQFLNQRTVLLSIDMPSRPLLVTATLVSEEDFILSDCTFPSIRVSPREYRLLIGASPPDPLSLGLVLPSGGSFSLTMTMEFDAPLIGTSVTGGPSQRIATRIRVVRRVDMKT
jgi:hypothetical protein